MNVASGWCRWCLLLLVAVCRYGADVAGSTPAISRCSVQKTCRCSSLVCWILGAAAWSQDEQRAGRRCSRVSAQSREMIGRTGADSAEGSSTLGENDRENGSAGAFSPWPWPGIYRARQQQFAWVNSKENSGKGLPRVVLKRLAATAVALSKIKEISGNTPAYCAFPILCRLTHSTSGFPLISIHIFFYLFIH
jgi:hypothetical protein